MARGDTTGRNRRPSGGYVSPGDQTSYTGRAGSSTSYTYNSRLTKQHEKVGRLRVRGTAWVISFFVSVSYANERVHHNKVVDAM